MSGTIGKSLYDVGRLASLLADLTSLQQAMNLEALAEADGSGVPGRLKMAIVALANVLRELVDEETAEMMADKAARAMTLRKQAAATVEKGVSSVNGLLAEINTRLAKIEGAPIPGGPSTLSKSIAPGDLSKMLNDLSADEQLDLTLRLAQRVGMGVGG